MIRSCIILLLFFPALLLKAQDFKSTVREQKEFYSAFQLSSEGEFDSLALANGESRRSQPAENSRSSCTLQKKVFGWHPYWGGSTYTAYQWNLLSDLCYFDYTISPSTGNNTNSSFAWNTASVVTVAKNNGTKIHICATMFSGHSTFWASSSAQTTFINNIVSLLNARNGNGVNIDFEGMGSSDKTPFKNFLINLRAALTAANPAYELSVCLYAVEWSSVFDIPALNNVVDYYTIMGYDYYYSGSTTAGPTSPLYNFQTSYNYTLSKTITYYIKQGIPPGKLLMGLPYYGREWQTSSPTAPSATSGTFTTSRTLSYINNNAATYSVSNKYWEGTCFSPFYAYQSSGNWRQCWIDDVYSLGRKYDMMLQRSLGGIAIWALGYDNGMTAYWDLIRDKFSDCAPVVCSDSLYDMGGPLRNYYDNENYSYVISAPTGSIVQLQFKSFGTENGYDSLWLYNGSGMGAPLIGVYTGTNSPGTVVSAGQHLTLRFKSDGATNTFGFKVMKSCLQPITTGFDTHSAPPLSVFPNPNNGRFSVIAKENSVLNLFDISGKLLYSITLGSPEEKIMLPPQLAPGIYLLECSSANGTARSRVIVQKD